MRDKFLHSLLVVSAISLVLAFGVTITQKREIKELQVIIQQLKKENKDLSETEKSKPDDFGGVGYIYAVSRDDLHIDVVGYGRFLIDKDEAQFLDKGDKAPQYILERGQ